MLDQLVTHWDRWARSTQGTRDLGRWAGSHPALAGFTPEGLREPRSSPATDAMQAALVDLAQTGESLALITLVIQMRPGLLRLIGWARTHGCASGTRREVVDDVVGDFAATVMGHSLDRRPRLIAANLILDTRQRIWRSHTRLARAQATPDGGRQDAASLLDRTASPEGSRAELRPEAMADRLDLVGKLAGAIADTSRNPDSRRLTAEVAYRAWILEERSAEIALQVGLRPEAVRARLSRLRAAVRPEAIGMSAQRESSRDRTTRCG